MIRFAYRTKDGREGEGEADIAGTQVDPARLRARVEFDHDLEGVEILTVEGAMLPPWAPDS